MTDPRTDCTCPTEHTIVRLGHCRSCPWHHAEQFEPEVGIRMVTRQMGETLRIVRVPEHLDGTLHDFDWATYADDRMSTGVCRCGTDEMGYDALVMP